MRKIIILVLSLLMVSSLILVAACQPLDQADQTDQTGGETVDGGVTVDVNPDNTEEVTEVKTTQGMRIAYFVTDLTEPFEQARAQAAIKYAMEQYGAVVTIMDGKSDSSLMLQNVEELVDSKFDGASLQVWDPEDAKASVVAALDAGVVMTSYFNPFSDTGIPIYRNNESKGSYEMGVSCAEQWSKANPDVPIVTIQLGWPSHPQVKIGRTEPFVQGIESVVGQGNYINLGCFDAKGSADAAKILLAEKLEEYPDINIIYSEAGVITPGVMAALTDAERGTMAEAVPTTEIVASFDCPASELSQIFDPSSSLKMSVALSPTEASKGIIELIVSIYLGTTEQTSAPVGEAFGEVKTIDYYNYSLIPEEALEWYNEQYYMEITVEDIS